MIKAYGPDSIKTERIKRNLTQQQAADICGVSKRTFMGWESGEHTPTDRNLWILNTKFFEEKG